MKEVSYKEVSNKIQEQFSRNGAFLTVKDKDGNVNTMTISWGNIGIMWRKPIFTVMVRYSRHTYKLIENADDFTLSIPTKGQLGEELAFCGTKSGRDFDKFKELNLSTTPGKRTNSPIISGCDLHLECRIVYKQPMDVAGMGDAVKAVYNGSEDYHVFYYGEIVSCLES